MKRKRYGVNSTYRGRRGGSSALKVLIAILAALLLIGVLSVLLLGKYIEYTDDGVRLVLPWLQEAKEDDRPSPAVSDDLIISEEPAVSVAPEPEPVVIPAGAVEVPVSAILDGTAAGLAGENAIVVMVKDLEGHLAWQSASPLAEEAKGSDGESLNGSPVFSQAVRRLADQEETYLVARLNCFCDLWMCVYDRSMILSTPGGKIWYDTKGMPWLSPANEAARAYINGLCLELAELGFDEILLDCAGFPESGRLSAVAEDANYPAGELEGAVTQWLAELTSLLEDSDTSLSVRTGRKDLDDCPSGRTAAALAGVRRVWVDETVDAGLWAEALAHAGVEDPEERVVQILSAEGEEMPESGWAVLTD